MSPVVAAALVGVGGSVVVAVVGFLTTRSITGRTINATVTVAREGRLWDKRAAAYEAALTELAQRGVKRERVLGPVGDTQGKAEALAEYFSSQDLSAWFAAEGKLLAYSSQDVWHALEDARQADRAASERFRQDSLPMEPGTEWKPELMKTISAVQASAQSDRALIELIRAELQDERSSRPPDGLSPPRERKQAK